MATSTITQTRAPSPQRRRKPDPAAVLQTYDYECKESGKRGAYRRTAERYGISEDTVERYVHRREEREAAKEAEAAAGLAYEPPPFADELAAPTPQILLHLTEAPAPNPARAQFDEREAMREVMSICADQDALNGACAGDMREHSPQDETPQSRSVELQEQPQIPAGPPHITPESDPAPDRPQSPTSPGHARPEINDAGSEMPNLPPEAFPDPSPNQPAQPDLPKSAAFYRSEPIVVRQIVRVPVEAHRGGLVAWLNDRPGVRNQLLAVAVFLLLVVMTWFG